MMRLHKCLSSLFALLTSTCHVQGLIIVPAENKDGLSRRKVAQIIGAGSLGFVGVMTGLPEPVLGDNSKPIAVIGASGRTGALCVTACLNRGIPVRALTRSGSWTPPLDAPPHLNEGNQLLDVRACDVKEADALKTGVAGCRGVIYAASASKKGGNANEIDNLGVVAAANACLAAKVPRYVVLSSTAVTRPESLGYKFTNVLGGIMDEKRKGEDGVRAAYKAAGSPSLSYAIIRPGGLEEPKKNVVLGPTKLEISQGDVVAGIISRADLAEATVALTLFDASNVRDTTFELYYTNSAQPCDARFRKLFINNEVARLHGDTYEKLFSGIKRDGEHNIPV